MGLGLISGGLFGGVYGEVDMTRKLHRRGKELADELDRLEEGNDEW
jgi:hypothetical protein